MTKSEFLFHLHGASYQALKIAEKYLKGELKTNFTYNVIFSASTGSMEDDKMKTDLLDVEVVDLLYREAKVPIWIEINVLESKENCTLFNLFCSGKYSSDKEKFHYNDDGSGPFGVKHPQFPNI